MLRQIELYPRQRRTKYWYRLFLVKVTKNDNVYSNPLLLTVRVPFVIQLGYVDLYVHSVLWVFFLLLFTGSRGKKGDDGAKAVSGWYTLTLSHPELMSIYLSLLCSRPFREHKMVKRPLEAPRTFSWRNWSKVWEARSTPQITLIQGVL